MSRVWDVRLSLSVDHPDLPGRVRNVSDPAAVLTLVDRAARASGGQPFLISIDTLNHLGWAMLYGCPWGWSLGLQDGFAHGPSDVYTTRGAVDGEAAWDFGPLFGQELEWPRRYFTDPSLARPALAAYLTSGMLWRGVAWEPTPDPSLLVGEADASPDGMSSSGDF